MLKSGTKVQQALAEISQTIAQINQQNPDQEARWLLEFVVESLIPDLIRDNNTLSLDQAEKLNALLKRRLKNEPLQYLLGTVDFHNITLKIDSRALIPRPETEGLVELGLEVIEHLIEPRVLDVGTGSGVIALAILSENATARVTGVDISKEALTLAQENCQLLQLNQRVDWIQVDLYADDFLRLAPPCYDLIISNPPYVSSSEYENLPEDVRLYEPASALLAGSDGLDALRRLSTVAESLLASHGTLLCEVGETHYQQALDLFKENGWDAEIAKDLSGKPRYLKAKIIEI